jgi:hypothetical protein
VSRSIGQSLFVYIGEHDLHAAIGSRPRYSETEPTGGTSHDRHSTNS